MVFGGYSEIPVVGLGLGFIGALAVVAVSTLLSTRDWARPLRYAGENSIVAISPSSCRWPRRGPRS